MARQLQPPPPPRCAAWAPRAARGAHAEESLDACGKKEMLLWGSALRLTAPRITRARRLSRRPSEPRSTSRGAARGAAVCAAWRCFCRTTHPLARFANARRAVRPPRQAATAQAGRTRHIPRAACVPLPPPGGGAGSARRPTARRRLSVPLLAVAHWRRLSVPRRCSLLLTEAAAARRA